MNGWEGKPNPGSDEAIALGCRCAVLDNNHGKYPPYPPDAWWITGGCPVHCGGHTEERTEPEVEDAK